jgi:two-component system CheB/CheR fusion protein
MVSQTHEPLYFVGVGASAGGLEALELFFSSIPKDTGLTFVVIQHLSPDHKSLMVELLSKRTLLSVRRAETGQRVEADTIYLIPPKKQLTIFHGKLVLSDYQLGRGIHLPIDTFFQSLAEDQGEKGVGIILSGTGSDGVRGIRAIKEAGGLILVQDEKSAKFDGMPRAAIATGLADLVLPPGEMAHQLISFIQTTHARNAEPKPDLLTDEDNLTKIFSILRDHSKVDFTYYKSNTVLRRLERRMTVNQQSSLKDYVSLLELRKSEVGMLYKELLIGVTSFFRDPAVFQALEGQYLPEILEKCAGKDLRFWVAGCSTGEEAYSLAILLQECLETQNPKPETIKIFATDIDRNAITFAGNGCYTESIAADLSPKILSKYFNKREDHFHIIRPIREMVVFAQHNLVKDPPFTHIDLVTCRNLLIYLQPILQQQVIDYINFSLNPGGYLVLGSSETPGEAQHFFDIANPKLKIYRSRGKKAHPIDLPRTLSTPRSSGGDSFSRRSGILSARQEERTQERLLESFAKSYVNLVIVVNEAMEVLHVVGEPEGYLRLPSGRLSNDVTRMAVNELAIPIATGLQKVFKQREEIRFTNIRLKMPDRQVLAMMHIKLLPQRKGQEALAGIYFLESSETPNGTARDQQFDIEAEAQQRIHDLELELQMTKENLQATIEELETSNEELQAANEELLASNEELQSTNEELQSVNEELHTVNIEYQAKIMELTELTNDLNNLMNISRVNTLFLDEHLSIRKFTPGITDIFNVLPTDIGRPLTHIPHRLKDHDPIALSAAAEANQQSSELEVESLEGHWYLMKIVPYQLGNRRFSGVVLTFTDIQSLIESRGQIQRDQEQIRALFDYLPARVVVADRSDGRILFYNTEASRAFDEPLLQENLHQRTHADENPCPLCLQSRQLLPQAPQRQWFHHNSSQPVDDMVIQQLLAWPGSDQALAEIRFDITEAKEGERGHQRLIEFLTQTASLAHLGGWEWHEEQKTMFWTPQTYAIHGIDPAKVTPGSREHIKQSLECYQPEDRAVVTAAFDQCCRFGTPYDLLFPFTSHKGDSFTIRTTAHAVRDKGRVVRVVGTIQRLTEPPPASGGV